MDEAVNIQLESTTITPPAPITTTKTKHRIHSEEDSLGLLPHKVLSKLSEGDFQGAVNLVCSKKTIADYLNETFTALEQSTHLLTRIHLLNNLMQTLSVRVSFLNLMSYML